MPEGRRTAQVPTIRTVVGAWIWGWRTPPRLPTRVTGTVEGSLTRQGLWNLERDLGRGMARWQTWLPSGTAGRSALLSPLPLLLPQADDIEIHSTKISCKVTSRFAHNVVTTKAINRANTAKEVSFDVELPKTAFITNFTLWVSSWLLALGRGGR